MCIGMVRNSVDHWWARYISTVFHIKAADLSHFLPYQVASWGMPLAAICGGLAAGNASTGERSQWHPIRFMFSTTSISSKRC
jgi:hypothetical protein